MKRAIVSWVAPWLLVGCNLLLEPPQEASQASASGASQTNPTGGALITSLNVTAGTTPNGDFPVAARVQMRAVVGSQYELRLNGELLESGNMPTEAVVAGPFSGLTSNDNIRQTYLTFAQAGANVVELTIIKDGQRDSTELSLDIGNQCSGLNENFFANQVQSSFNSCTGCHTEQPDNSSFAALKRWDKIRAASERYFVAHVAAQFDAWPQAVGGALVHSGGERWVPGSAEHLRAIELLYRMASDFSCPA
ncbi:MAG: hypothetical protein MUQ43_07805 [Reinekea forsetii]|jgi:hypothetical protein|uniref:Uncharacterized protein n=1 Tax=Reinekea forsetii TaxID=1336806 RepID=A0A2K8KVX4_9GAMM|nr:MULTISPECIES: hypothetical protein [Reinekea]ATX78119.1 hypothetical protein REIFOR_03000 [Reinekea forsetii]MDO7642545.1 hypothetical protein [Reinekea forsetii]MDO7644969.1 hypothetical protein [Reinekea forsetii]MDO7674315.1 hypothetical protein [Reinekea forsetii]